MVAAALESAHKDVISNLPKYSTNMPIVRFMAIPLTTRSTSEDYVLNTILELVD